MSLNYDTYPRILHNQGLRPVTLDLHHVNLQIRPSFGKVFGDPEFAEPRHLVPMTDDMGRVTDRSAFGMSPPPNARLRSRSTPRKLPKAQSETHIFWHVIGSIDIIHYVSLLRSISRKATVRDERATYISLL
jgi:hypothetical protein